MKCHAETRSEELSMEECGIMKDLEPISECARGVVEPASLVRASTSFIQTAASIIVCLDHCDSGINTESEAGSCTEDLENEGFETDKLAPQNTSIKTDGPAEVSVPSKRTRKIRISKKKSFTGKPGSLITGVFGVGIQSSVIDLGFQHYSTKVLVGAPPERDLRRGA